MLAGYHQPVKLQLLVQTGHQQPHKDFCPACTRLSFSIYRSTCRCRSKHRYIDCQLFLEDCNAPISTCWCHKNFRRNKVMEAKDLEHDWLIQSSFCRQQGFHGEHGWLIQSSFCRQQGFHGYFVCRPSSMWLFKYVLMTHCCR